MDEAAVPPGTPRNGSGPEDGSDDGNLHPVRPGTGSFTVTIGRRWYDRLVARAAGHHRPGQVRVTMTVEPLPPGHDPPRERWARTIGGRRLATTAVWDTRVVVAGAGGTGSPRRLTEWLGPLGLVFRLGSGDNDVTMDLLGARLGTPRRSIPLPAVLFPAVSAVAGPSGSATADPDGARGWWVRVVIRSRRGRPILSYEGVLT